MISSNPVVQNALRSVFTKAVENYGKRLQDAIMHYGDESKIAAMNEAFDNANRLKRMLDGDEIVDRAFVDAVNEMRQRPRPKF